MSSHINNLHQNQQSAYTQDPSDPAASQQVTDPDPFAIFDQVDRDIQSMSNNKPRPARGHRMQRGRSTQRPMSHGRQVQLSPDQSQVVHGWYEFSSKEARKNRVESEYIQADIATRTGYGYANGRQQSGGTYVDFDDPEGRKYVRSGNHKQYNINTKASFHPSSRGSRTYSSYARSSQNSRMRGNEAPAGCASEEDWQYETESAKLWQI